jgi:hypothetical protein
MKQVSFKIICLIIFASIAVFSAYGDDVPSVILQTVILESFNGDDNAAYVWKTDASRFITRTEDLSFPILSFVDAYPNQAFRVSRTNPNPDPLRSLGIHGRFDRKGYNWIDIYPVRADDPDAKPVGIPIPGRVRTMDMWVWGANLRYYIEVYIRDDNGVPYALKLGDISFRGWRNLSVNIPTNIPQSRRTLPSHAGLQFIKFRIWTQPVERVDNFYIYFKQLKILTDVYEALFDGSDLGDPDFVESLWSSN